jgi:hypothetical protein
MITKLSTKTGLKAMSKPALAFKRKLLVVGIVAKHGEILEKLWQLEKSKTTFFQSWG